MDTDDTYRLQRSLGYQLSLTSRLQERRFEEQLHRLGLTRITWCILLAVEVEAVLNPSDIAAFVGIDRTATSRALRQMEAADMIRRTAGETDRRTTTVALTQKGRNLHRSAIPMARASAQHWRGKLTDAETRELHRLLRKLRRGEDTALKRL